MASSELSVSEPQTTMDFQRTRTPPLDSPMYECGLDLSPSDSDNLTDDAKLEVDNDHGQSAAGVSSHQNDSDMGDVVETEEEDKSNSPLIGVSKDDHDNLNKTESSATPEDNAETVTDQETHDLELDWVMDDQVMSFVNLAISNAMKSTLLDATGIEMVSSTNTDVVSGYEGVILDETKATQIAIGRGTELEGEQTNEEEETPLDDNNFTVDDSKLLKGDARKPQVTRIDLEMENTDKNEANTPANIGGSKEIETDKDHTTLTGLITSHGKGTSKDRTAEAMQIESGNKVSHQEEINKLEETTERFRPDKEVQPDLVEMIDKRSYKGAGEPEHRSLKSKESQNLVLSQNGEEGDLQRDENVKSTQDKLINKNMKEDVNNGNLQDEAVGIPVKKVAGLINARVSNIVQDAADNEAANMTPRGEPSKPEAKQEDSSGEIESGLALVNDRLRIRIAELQSQIKELCCELAFVGDRNWRLEAYMDCLIHTLEKMAVTDIEDLDHTTLPLGLFKVKVKAGYRLGPYNRLPQRTRRSYQCQGLIPPTIDLSGGSLGCQTPQNGKGEVAFSISPTDDIGLSAKQMQQYEARIESLTMKNHFMETQLQHLTAAGMATPATTPGDSFGNPNYSVLPSQDFPFSYCPSAPPGIQNYGVPINHLNGAPAVQATPPRFNMAPQRGIYTTDEVMEDPTVSSLQQPPPMPAPLPAAEIDHHKVHPYVPPPRFQSKQDVGPNATSSAPDARRQSFGSSGRYKNDWRYGRGKSATDLSTSGPGWRRTSQSALWRTQSHAN